MNILRARQLFEVQHENNSHPMMTLYTLIRLNFRFFFLPRQSIKILITAVNVRGTFVTWKLLRSEL